MTSGAPIMSSQKIGPNSLASRARCCSRAVESRDSMLPTTGLVGGCGVGLSRLVGAVVIITPAICRRHPEERALARVSKDGRLHLCLSSFEARPSGLAPQDDEPNL